MSVREQTEGQLEGLPSRPWQLMASAQATSLIATFFEFAFCALFPLTSLFNGAVTSWPTLTFYFFFKKSTIRRPGGALTLEGSMGVPPSRPPFPGQILAPETHLFKPWAPETPPGFFFFKTCFSTWTNFCRLSGNSSFKPKKSVPETLFLKARAAPIYLNF